MKTLKDMENEISEAQKQVNNNLRDVDKALIDYCHGQDPSHRFSPITILDLRAFAKFYAKRCGLIINEKK